MTELGYNNKILSVGQVNTDKVNAASVEAESINADAIQGTSVEATNMETQTMEAASVKAGEINTGAAKTTSKDIPEFLYVITDADGKLIEGIGYDGVKYIMTKLIVQGVDILELVKNIQDGNYDEILAMIDAIIGEGNTTTKIDCLNDIIAFLNGYTNGQKLTDLLAELANREITKADLSTALWNEIAAAGGGTITNNPDDEDLESFTKDNTSYIRFKNRNTAYGGGYIILRKNIVNGVNLLTSSVFTQENTTYEVRYDFDLNGASISIPSGCTLHFVGGSFSNGAIVGSNLQVISERPCFDNVALSGTLANREVNGNWFKFANDEQAVTLAIAASNATGKPLVFDGEWNINVTSNTTHIVRNSIDFGNSKFNVNLGDKTIYKFQVGGAENSSTDATLLSALRIVVENKLTTIFSTMLSSAQQNALKVLLGSYCVVYPTTTKYTDADMIDSIRLGSGGTTYLKREMMVVTPNGDIVAEFHATTFPISQCYAAYYYTLNQRHIIKGGTFTYTSNSSVDRVQIGFYAYGAVHTIIEDMNVELSGVTASMNGFFTISRSYDYLLEDVLVVAPTEQQVRNYSYVVDGHDSTNVVLDRVTCPIMDNSTHWGNTQFEYCEDVKFIDCTFNRIDSHHRTNNMDIIRCKVGNWGINYSGGGRWRIIGTSVSHTIGTGTYFIRGREDWSSEMRGDIYIRDCKVIIANGQTSATIVTASIGYTGEETMYKAYPTYGNNPIPMGGYNIKVDGFTVETLDYLEVKAFSVIGFNVVASGLSSGLPQYVTMPNLDYRNIKVRTKGFTTFYLCKFGTPKDAYSIRQGDIASWADTSTFKKNVNFKIADIHMGCVTDISIDSSSTYEADVAAIGNQDKMPRPEVCIDNCDYVSVNDYFYGSNYKITGCRMFSINPKKWAVNNFIYSATTDKNLNLISQ